MKPFTARFIAVVLIISTPLLSKCADNKPPSAVAQTPKRFRSIELHEAIKPGAKPLAPGFYKLSREWVGSLSSIGDASAKNELTSERPETIRFNYILVNIDHSIELESISIAPNGEASGPTPYCLTIKLHSADEINKTRDLKTLKSWFGNQHGLTDGWGSDEHMHWSEGWRYFSANPDGTITCQNIFAHVSEKRKIEKSPEANGPVKSKIISREPARVDIMNLRQGVFRPVKSAE